MNDCHHENEIDQISCFNCISRHLTALTDWYKSLIIRFAGQQEFKLNQIYENQKIRERINEIEKMIEQSSDQISECRELLAMATKNILSVKKSPHKCPVCDGKGNMKEEVEHKILKFEICNSCKGKGIVWG